MNRHYFLLMMKVDMLVEVGMAMAMVDILVVVDKFDLVELLYLLG